VVTTDWSTRNSSALDAPGPSAPKPASGHRSGRLTLAYVGAWALMAIAAVAYLAILALRPELASAVLPSISPGAPESNQGQRAMTRALAEVDGLKQSVGELRADIGAVKQELARRNDDERGLATLRSDVIDLRTTLAEHGERERALSGRVAAIEAQQTALQTRSAPQLAETNSTVTTGSTLESANVTGRVEEPVSRAGQAKRPVERRAARTTQAQVASASSVPAFAAPKVKVAGPSAVQLDIASSTDDLRLSWLRLTATHGDTLKRLEPRYVTIKKGDTSSYRLIVGPVADSAEASRLCAQLKVRKESCILARFGGQPL
jgi:phage shock protein A